MTLCRFGATVGVVLLKIHKRHALRIAERLRGGGQKTMNAIPPWDAGSVGSTQLPIRSGDVNAAKLAGSSTRLTGAGVSSNAQGIPEIFTALTDLLRGIGGGPENDKLLRGLIALIVLLYLLKILEESPDLSRSGLDQLGAGRNTPPLFITMQSSSTTITIQQTSTTLVVGGTDQTNAAFGGDGAQGDQIDISV